MDGAGGMIRWRHTGPADVVGELVESASLWQTAAVDESAVKSDERGVVVVDA